MASLRKTYEVFGYRVFAVTHTTHADPDPIEDDEIEEYPEDQLLRLTTSDNSFGFTDHDPVFSERYWEEGEDV
jgi:hypothetical protein